MFIDFILAIVFIIFLTAILLINENRIKEWVDSINDD